MSGILCAIRGGPGSQTTIAEAIALAQRTDLSLYFLYIVNLDFLTHTSTTRVHTISEEMHEMGEFILLQAQTTASALGVDAKGVVRHGNVGEEIVKLCHELEIDYLVVGRPHAQREDTVFTQAMLTQFVAETEHQTGAKVVVAGGGEQ